MLIKRVVLILIIVASLAWLGFHSPQILSRVRAVIASNEPTPTPVGSPSAPPSYVVAERAPSSSFNGFTTTAGLDGNPEAERNAPTPSTEADVAVDQADVVALENTSTEIATTYATGTTETDRRTTQVAETEPLDAPAFACCRALGSATAAPTYTDSASSETTRYSGQITPDEISTDIATSSAAPTDTTIPTERVRKAMEVAETGDASAPTCCTAATSTTAAPTLTDVTSSERKSFLRSPAKVAERSALGNEPAGKPATSEVIPEGVLEALVALAKSQHRQANAAPRAALAAPPAAFSEASEAHVPINTDVAINAILQHFPAARRIHGAIAISVPAAVFTDEAARKAFAADAAVLIYVSKLSVLLIPTPVLQMPANVENIEGLRRDLESAAAKPLRPYSFTPVVPIQPSSTGIELVVIP